MDDRQIVTLAIHKIDYKKIKLNKFLKKNTIECYIGMIK
jgi:hypothetical protein